MVVVKGEKKRAERRVGEKKKKRNRGEDGPGERVERDVANVVVPVEQEAAQNVDGQHAQPRVALHVHDGLDALVENGIARVFRTLRVGRHLRQHVVHRLRGLVVALAQPPHELQQLDLHEWIDNAPHVVLWRKPHGDETAQQLDERGHHLDVLVLDVWLNLEHLEHELHARQQHCVCPVLEQRDESLAHVLNEVGLFANEPNRR